MDPIHIRGMREEDWPAVSKLIELEWESNHPVLDKNFFYWQHSGFGRSRGLSSTPLAFFEGRLVGMRGIIPGEYQVPAEQARYDYVSGAAFAMWIVAKDFRGRGIGKKLLQYCEAQFGAMVALGSNEDTSVPLYLRNSFRRLDGLHHWYAILTVRAQNLLFGPVSRFALIPIEVPRREFAQLATIGAEQLADLWRRFSKAFTFFAVNKTADFWDWRYFNHPVFDYKTSHDPELDIAAVHRVEKVNTSGGEVRVLRIVEIVAGSTANLKQDLGLTMGNFLLKLLVQQIEQGVDAVDFRASNNLFHNGLKIAGFRRMDYGLADSTGLGFAGRLNPLLLGPSPINLHWKNGGSLETQMTYFTKSDSDMDRPNSRGQRSPRLG